MTCQTKDNRQICAILQEAKNLTTVEETKTLAGEIGKTQQDVKGKLVEFAWKMQKRQLSEETIKHRIYRLNVLVKKGADLTNPESVETVLATEKWTPSNKRFFVMAYHAFAKAMKIEWEPIKIKCQSKQPFIPLESEIDALISGCGKRTATLLQLLKDTGARIGEAAKLQWVDVDTENNVVRINNPEKGSASRTIKLSDKTVAMIKALPKKSSYIFSTKTRSLESVFDRQRNKLAMKLQNPRLKQIHFHTFRHWKATITYHKTRDILLVKYMLGHKRLENTEVYTHLVDFQSEEFHSATAKTLDEAKMLIEDGFEYVTEMEGVKLFRKRK
jgi:integrase